MARTLPASGDPEHPHKAIVFHEFEVFAGSDFPFMFARTGARFGTLRYARTIAAHFAKRQDRLSIKNW